LKTSNPEINEKIDVNGNQYLQFVEFLGSRIEILLYINWQHQVLSL